MKDEELRKKVLEMACELAFGKSNDAVKLAFLSGEDLSELEGLDLSALAGLHRAANGGVELRLTDRLKLIELLLAATEGGDGAGGSESLIGALNAAAGRMGEAGAVRDAEIQ